jgi:predicted dehydrogenase
MVDAYEARATLCGTKGGADMNNGSARINGDDFGRLYEKTPRIGAGGVAFYDSAGDDPTLMEQMVFYNAVTKGKPLVILPEQAYVVTQLLEAIYDSAKTGKLVTF